MTFRLFNKLNEVFKVGNEIVLRRYSDTFRDYCNMNYYDENSDIMDIDNDLKEYPYAKLFVFDGYSYKELDM